MQSNQIKPQPNFSHRLADSYNPASADSMMFEVETVLMRAKGMLGVLDDLLTAHAESIDSENMSWAIQSVINELKDTMSLVTTYHDAINQA